MAVSSRSFDSLNFLVKYCGTLSTSWNFVLRLTDLTDLTDSGFFGRVSFLTVGLWAKAGAVVAVGAVAAAVEAAGAAEEAAVEEAAVEEAAAAEEAAAEEAVAEAAAEVVTEAVAEAAAEVVTEAVAEVVTEAVAETAVAVVVLIIFLTLIFFIPKNSPFDLSPTLSAILFCCSVNFWMVSVAEEVVLVGCWKSTISVSVSVAVAFDDVWGCTWMPTDMCGGEGGNGDSGVASGVRLISEIR